VQSDTQPSFHTHKTQTHTNTHKHTYTHTHTHTHTYTHTYTHTHTHFHTHIHTHTHTGASLREDGIDPSHRDTYTRGLKELKRNTFG